MKKWHVAAALLIGLLAGSFAGPCLQLIPQRWPNVGGEVLILPLFGLLVWFGYQMGKDINTLKIASKGYDAGFSEAMSQARPPRTQSWQEMQEEMACEVGKDEDIEYSENGTHAR